MINNKCNYKTITRIVLVLTLLSYLVLSLGLMRYNREIPQDVLFGTDTIRVYHDFFDITGTSHYRTKVHPLLLLLLQPFMSIAIGIVHHAGTALALVESLTGFGIVFFTNRILDMLVKNKTTVIILTMIFAFSFSQMIFVSIPETFIFGGFTTSLCWYYIIKHRDNYACLLEGKQRWVIVFLGILCFGITITNYIQYVIVVMLILYSASSERKTRVKNFIQINVITLGLATILSVLQKITWRNGTEIYAEQIVRPALRKILQFWDEVPSLLMPLQVKVSRSSFEEKAYMNFDFNLEKIAAWIDETVRCPLLSGDCYWIWIDKLNRPKVYFSEYTPLTDMVVGAFVVFLVFIVIKYWKTLTSKHIFCAIICAYVFNLVLHFIYGAREAFMYTPHFLFLLIVIYGMASNEIQGLMTKINHVFLSLLLIFELIVNIHAYNSIRLFLIDYLLTPKYSMVILMVGVVISMGMIYYILHKWYIYKKVAIESCIDYINTLEGIYNCIMLYATICFLYMIFVFSASFIK